MQQPSWAWGHHHALAVPQPLRPHPKPTMCTIRAAALPVYLPAVAAGLRSSMVAPAWCATAWASSVLPLPGGPYSSTVRGACSLRRGAQGARGNFKAKLAVVMCRSNWLHRGKYGGWAVLCWEVMGQVGSACQLQTVPAARNALPGTTSAFPAPVELTLPWQHGPPVGAGRMPPPPAAPAPARALGTLAAPPMPRLALPCSSPRPLPAPWWLPAAAVQHWPSCRPSWPWQLQRHGWQSAARGALAPAPVAPRQESPQGRKRQAVAPGRRWPALQRWTQCCGPPAAVQSGQCSVRLWFSMARRACLALRARLPQVG